MGNSKANLGDYPSPRTALLLDSSLGHDRFYWCDEWHQRGCFARVSTAPFGKMSGHFSTQSSWCSSLSLCSKCRHLTECPGHTKTGWPRSTQCPAESSSTGPHAISVLWKTTGSSLLPARSKGVCVWLQKSDISAATPQIWALHPCYHNFLQTQLMVIKSLPYTFHPHFSSWHQTEISCPCSRWIHTTSFPDLLFIYHSFCAGVWKQRWNADLWTFSVTEQWHPCSSHWCDSICSCAVRVWVGLFLDPRLLGQALLPVHITAVAKTHHSSTLPRV